MNTHKILSRTNFSVVLPLDFPSFIKLQSSDNICKNSSETEIQLQSSGDLKTRLLFVVKKTKG